VRTLGWIGPGSRSHRRRCRRDWHSLTQAHCTVCCEHFGSGGIAAFTGEGASASRSPSCRRSSGSQRRHTGRSGEWSPPTPRALPERRSRRQCRCGRMRALSPAVGRCWVHERSYLQALRLQLREPNHGREDRCGRCRAVVTVPAALRRANGWTELGRVPVRWRSSGSWGSCSTAVMSRVTSTRKCHQAGRTTTSGHMTRCGAAGQEVRRVVGAVPDKDLGQDDRRGVRRCAYRRRVAASRPIRQAVTCRASSLCAWSSPRELAGLPWLRGDLGSLLGRLRPRRLAAFVDRLVRLFRRRYTPWRRPGPDRTLRRRGTRCLPSATAAARLQLCPPDERERTHRGHDCGLFPRRPTHPQERPGHAGHDSFAGSLPDFPRSDLHAITNDCQMPHAGMARRCLASAVPYPSLADAPGDSSTCRT